MLIGIQTGNRMEHVKVQQQIQDESTVLSLVSSANLVWYGLHRESYWTLCYNLAFCSILVPRSHFQTKSQGTLNMFYYGTLLYVDILYNLYLEGRFLFCVLMLFSYEKFSFFVVN